MNTIKSDPEAEVLRTFPILRWFEYEHLPPHLRAVSQPFAVLAYELVGEVGLEPGPETTTALRKLLEGKDAAVRALIETQERGAR